MPVRDRRTHPDLGRRGSLAVWDHLSGCGDGRVRRPHDLRPARRDHGGDGRGIHGRPGAERGADAVSRIAGLGQGPLRVAVAGAGYISQFHLAGWRDTPGVELVAVCDPAAEKAKARAAQFGVAAVYADFAQMLDRERLDAVDIATPVQTHGALVRLA
ncbi:MAG: hypothetical protein EHM71_02380, partial [Zetaproteobacteria bacterium]